MDPTSEDSISDDCGERRHTRVCRDSAQHNPIIIALREQIGQEMGCERTAMVQQNSARKQVCG